jgi:hypothetical protein
MRKKPMPCVQYLAFVMPMYDIGTNPLTKGAEFLYVPSEQHLSDYYHVYGWVYELQEWALLDDFYSYEEAKSAARAYHERECERFELTPYVD